MSVAPLPDAFCRRCGSSHLSVQALAWAEYRDGEFVRLESRQPIAPLADPARYAVCFDCGVGQKLESGEA